MISIVVAHSRNMVVGRDGEIPWWLPSDMKYFRDLTMGHTVVMGRKTFESLAPAFRPLPGRRNVVLSTDPDYHAEGAEVFASLEEALANCADGCFVIGGGVTYAQALAHARYVHATEIDREIEGDAFFPQLDQDEWDCVREHEPISENGHDFCVRIYERRS